MSLEHFQFWWETTAHFLTGVSGVAVLSSIILAIFVLFLARFLIVSRKLLGPLSDALKVLCRIKTQEQFTTEFEFFDEGMRKNELIAHNWSEFVECLIMPSPDGRQVISNTLEPSEYFSTETLLASRLNLRLYNAIPNILTGLGILGTFIGLAFGIYLAQGSIISTDQKTMLKALSDLLGGASLAFWTSVTGLISSLIFNGVEKRRIHHVQSLIDSWNRQLDSLLDRTTEERIAHEILSESRRQRMQLEKFNTDLAVSIASALDEKLTARLQPTLESLITAMEQLKEEKVQQNQAFLQSLASDFKDSLSGAAKSEMVELTAQLTELTKNIKLTVADLTDAGAGTGQTLVQASEAFASEIRAVMTEAIGSLNAKQASTESAFKNAMDTMTVHLDQIAELVDEASIHLGDRLKSSAGEAGQILADSASHIGGELRRAADRMELVTRETQLHAEKLSEVLSGLNTFNASSRESLDQLTTTIGSLKNVHEAIRNTATPLLSASSKLGDVGETLDSSLGRIEKLTGGLQENSERVDLLAQRLVESWQNIERRYVGVDESLGKVFDQLQLSVDQYTDQIRGFVSELDQSFAQAITKLSGAILDLSAVVEDLENTGRTGDWREPKA